MRLSHSLLLAGVAVLALPSCSSAQGPGAVGSKNDIVVRNHGEAPLPPPAEDLAAALAGQPQAQGQSEAVLQQEAGTPPEMMATRAAVQETVQDAQRAGDQVLQQTEHEALSAQQQAQQAQEAAVQAARQAQSQPAPQMDAVPAPAVVQHNQAPAPAPVPQQAEAVAAPVPSPELVQSPAAHVDSSLATRPATTVAGETPTLSPSVDAGRENRAGEVSPVPAQETAVVVSPPVEQAATEFQAQPVDQAAQRALANPPTPVATGPEGERPAPAAAPRAVQQQPAVAPAPQPVSRPAYAGAYVPTPEEIAAGGVRVVTTDDGQKIDKPYDGAEAPAAAAPAPAAQQPQPERQPVPGVPGAAAVPAAPAPVVQQPAIVDGKPVLDRAMITRAQQVLAEKGFYTGLPDGEMSTQTLNALSRYQSANFLKPGGMTVETARHMGLVE